MNRGTEDTVNDAVLLVAIFINDSRAFCFRHVINDMIFTEQTTRC
jgi:hypothetical protein